MLFVWGILVVVIIFGILIMFGYFSRKPQYWFSKKKKYIHVRSVKIL